MALPRLVRSRRSRDRDARIRLAVEPPVRIDLLRPETTVSVRIEQQIDDAVTLLLGRATPAPCSSAGRGRPARSCTGRTTPNRSESSGEFHYVGANDAAAFLIAGPEGHVCSTAGYPTAAPMIMAACEASASKRIKAVRCSVNRHRPCALVRSLREAGRFCMPRIRAASNTYTGHAEGTHYA